MKKWIILILIAALWGFGTILAWTMRDAGCHVFMYFGEGDAVEKQLITHALDSEQEQGRNMLPEITAWSRAKRLKDWEGPGRRTASLYTDSWKWRHIPG